MGKRGRPIQSEIRRNIVEILFFLKQGYGYQISRIYQKLFPHCTREVVYYHLKKGVSLGEFELKEIKSEKGDFSWGDTVQKRYYALGPKASPKGEERVRECIESMKIA
jgi:hypothetical protein